MQGFPSESVSDLGSGDQREILQKVVHAVQADLKQGWYRRKRNETLVLNSWFEQHQGLVTDIQTTYDVLYNFQEIILETRKPV